MWAIHVWVNTEKEKNNRLVQRPATADTPSGHTAAERRLLFYVLVSSLPIPRIKGGVRDSEGWQKLSLSKDFVPKSDEEGGCATGAAAVPYSI